ncbi:hypothetical protein E2C01_078045 [Portunus trituberculatus]|uniref:Uncharacterized protein n=1 Tax=Portunus trituberculatus TaxID=210409 RepID=A0A5B7INZ7_PORTR|nr:hypothetical protein [Portunus trituberculatus]
MRLRDDQMKEAAPSIQATSESSGWGRGSGVGLVDLCTRKSRLAELLHSCGCDYVEVVEAVEEVEEGVSSHCTVFSTSSPQPPC